MSELRGAGGRSTSEVFPLDDVDRAIITELQVDGRMSYTDLALSRRGLDAITILKRNADNEPALAELKSVAADLLRGDRAGNHVHEAVLAVYIAGSLAADHERTFARGRESFRLRAKRSNFKGRLCSLQ